MKIQELRELLKDADKSSMEKAFAELYKQVAKSKKEEIDPVITAILQGQDVQKKEAQPVDFAELKSRIETFIDNAYAQNYLAPNRVIPKNQRPKWRFLVKNYIKELGKIPQDSPDHGDAAELLKKLYRMLCAACNVYLFSTEDPFRSVGIEQTDLCRQVLVNVFSSGYTRENIRDMLLMVTTGGLDRETLYTELEFLLLGELEVSDVKYMAIQEAKELICGKEKEIGALTRYSSGRFQKEECVNELCNMILMTAAALCEPEPEVEYYFKHCQESNKEIILYKILEVLWYMDDDKTWVWAYEYAVKKGIKPREELQKRYVDMTENVPSE